MVSVTFEDTLLEKMYILDMYSPITVKKIKIVYLTWTFFLAQRCQRRWKYFFEYLREVGTESEDSLECESGVHMGSIYEKNRRPKISCYCPFNLLSELNTGYSIIFFIQHV
jgi:hypothetical protein